MKTLMKTMLLMMLAALASHGQDQSVFRPEDFGALGDGVTDDSAALQAAETALASAGGGVLQLQAKTYEACFLLDSYVWLRGDFNGSSKIQAPPGSNCTPVAGRHFSALDGTAQQIPETRGDNYVKISDLTIDGDAAQTRSYGVTAASWSGGVATYSTAYNIWPGGLSVTIAGVNPSGYNQTCTITVLDPYHFSCPLGSSPGSYVSGGTATATYGSNTAGRCAALWGLGWDLQNVVFQNCAGDGLVTEYSDASGPSGPFVSNPQLGDSRGQARNLKFFNNGGNGWTYEGPNDGMIDVVTSSGNAGWALQTKTNTVSGTCTTSGATVTFTSGSTTGFAGGSTIQLGGTYYRVASVTDSTHLVTTVTISGSPTAYSSVFYLGTLDAVNHWNSYNDVTGGLSMGSGAQILAQEGDIWTDTATCLEASGAGGNIFMTNMVVGGCSSVALDLGSGPISFNGWITNSAIGIKLTATANLQITATLDDNTTGVDIVSESGPSNFSLQIFGQGGSTPVSGTFAASDTVLGASVIGSNAAYLVQIPGVFSNLQGFPSTLSVPNTSTPAKALQFFTDNSNNAVQQIALPTGTTWVALTAYSLGKQIVDPNGNIQKVTTAGTSGSTEPAPAAWSSSGTTSDGSVVWTFQAFGGNTELTGNVVTLGPYEQPTSGLAGFPHFFYPNGTVADYGPKLFPTYCPTHLMYSASHYIGFQQCGDSAGGGGNLLGDQPITVPNGFAAGTAIGGKTIAGAGDNTANATTGVTVSTTCTSSSMSFPVSISCTSTVTDPGHHHVQQN